MSRGGTLGVVVLSLALSLSASASAATRYVEKTGSSNTGDCTDHASPCATIMYAVSQAANDDTIQIGPGNFIEEVNTDKRLTFVGAGAGTIALPLAATRIIGPAGTSSAGHPAMSLPSGGTVRGLRVEGGPGSGSSVVSSGEAGGTGIVFPSDTSAPATLRLEQAVVVGGDGGYGKEFRGTAGVGLRMSSGPGPVALSAADTEFAGGQGFGLGDGIWVDGPAASADLTNSRIPNEDAEGFGDGLVVFEGAQVSMRSSEVSTRSLGAVLYDGSLSIDHSRINAEGSALYLSGGSEESPEAKVVDSLVVARKAEALDVVSEEGGSATVAVSGSTVIGHGLAAADATRAEGAGPASITLRNSIARNLVPSGLPIPTYDLLANGGTIDADFSSFSTRGEENGGSVTAPGSAANVAGDPGLLDEQHGVYLLGNASPLIDRGDPGIVQPGETDLLGSPRSLDGNRDCAAAPDIGAFEVTGQEAPCDAPPVLSGVGMTNRVFAPAGGGTKKGRRAALSAKKRGVKRGTRFTYSLSEPARLSIAIERALPGRKLRRGGRTRCVKATPGRRKPPCFRFVGSTALSVAARAGRQSTFFSGLKHGKPLKPGKYRARLWAVDSAGQKSQTRQVSFRIVRGS